MDSEKRLHNEDTLPDLKTSAVPPKTAEAKTGRFCMMLCLVREKKGEVAE